MASIDQQKSTNAGTCPSTTCQKQKNRCRPIWFCVFSGCPGISLKPFDHVHFDASVPDHFFQDQPVSDLSPRTPSSGLERPQRALQNGTGAEYPIYPVIIKLAVKYGDQIIMRQKDGCAVCHMPAQSFVHRPICVTRNGYLELPDFTLLYRLMMSFAYYTSDIGSIIDKYRATSNFLNDRPYLCAIAAPVCAPKNKCHDLVSRNVKAYIESLCEGQLKFTRLREAFESRLAETCDISKPSSPNDGDAEGGDLEQSNIVTKSSPRPPRRQNESPNPPRDEECEITAAILVGRPRLQIVDPPPRGCLSCFVFSSIWPKDTLPNPFKNKADLAIDCCRVLASLEEDILRSTEYRCAICSELVKATCLLHHPISISVHWQSEAIRKAVMAMFQFVKGSWNFPETELVFGSNKRAHIFDFAVPICAPGTICEDVARTAAREFIKLVLPESLQMQFPGLEPDTDLPSLRDGLGWARNDSQLVLQKMGSEGLMSEKADRGENPEDSTLTITKLRRWHEMCFSQELIKRQFLRKHGYRRAGDNSDSESDDTEADPGLWTTPCAEPMDTSLLLEKPPTLVNLPQTEDLKAVSQNRRLPRPTLANLQMAYQNRPLPRLPAIDDDRDESFW
ncbi:hypothetical protein DTO280E4_3649 [Paecilomyces variotii]|nr:hypothetical protein DTO280E4_3649 [Paecilomyces variotii]